MVVSQYIYFILPRPNHRVRDLYPSLSFTTSGERNDQRLVIWTFYYFYESKIYMTQIFVHKYKYIIFYIVTLELALYLSYSTTYYSTFNLYIVYIYNIYPSWGKLCISVQTPTTFIVKDKLALDREVFARSTKSFYWILKTKSHQYDQSDISEGWRKVQSFTIVFPRSFFFYLQGDPTYENLNW